MSVPVIRVGDYYRGGGEVWAVGIVGGGLYRGDGLVVVVPVAVERGADPAPVVAGEEMMRMDMSMMMRIILTKTMEMPKMEEEEEKKRIMRQTRMEQVTVTNQLMRSICARSQSEQLLPFCAPERESHLFESAVLFHHQQTVLVQLI